MSQAPYMPLFVDAYLADTMHLSAEEGGVYLLLLMGMWRHGGKFPDNDKQLARLTKLSVAKWKRIRVVLTPMLVIENGILSQKRLKKEWEYVQGISVRQSKNANARWLKNKASPHANGHAKPHAKPMPDACPHTHPIPIPNKKEEKDSPEFEEFWKVYPKKVGKDDAKKVFAAKRKQTSFEAIMAGLKRYATSRKGEDPRFTAYPATWLNGGRWADEESAHRKQGPPVACDVAGRPLKHL